MASVLSEEQFTCCICLDLFRRPVSIPCGHNFCLSCIQGFWDTARRSECPLCKEHFPRRPELRINHALADITEGFKRSLKVKPDQANGQGTSQGGRETEERKATPRSRNVCGRHRQPLDIYCKTEQVMVCSKCAEGQHRGHQTVNMDRESNRMRAELCEVESKMQRMVQDRLEKLDEVKLSAQESRKSMEKELEDGRRIFSDLLSSIQRSQAELEEDLKEKQGEVERRAASLSEELEKEIAEIVMKKSEVEQFTNSQDPLHLLQNFHSVVTPPRTKDWSQTCITNPHAGTVRRALATLEEMLRKQERNLCEAELRQIQQYAVDISFDPQTAAPWLVFSSDLKQASLGYQPSAVPSPPSPLRFDSCVCVLGQPGITTGRRYWVVQVGDKTDWELGVARESIKRKGAIVVRPDQGFWAVCRQKGGNLVACAGPAVPLVSCHERLQRVGVFVDHEEGLVSFYDVEARSHIYSYTGCTFGETLYPYFNPCLHNDGKNTAPLIICPIGGEVPTPGLDRRTGRPPPLIRRQSSQAFISQQTPS